MKNELSFLSLILIILFSFNSTRTQDNSTERKSAQINQTTRIVHTTQGDFLVPPNIRPYPSTASEATVNAVTMSGNQNVMFAVWNSIQWSPLAFYGTGFCFTNNGGVTWTGNYQMIVSGNLGNPALWIWPSTSSWPGRLGVTVVGSAGISSTFSTDNGNTWAPFVIVGGSSTDKNRSCVDESTGSPFIGRTYTMWTDFGGSNINRIVGAFSSNGGVSWTGYQPVSPVPIAGHYCNGCDIAVGPGGIVYVCWANCISNGQNSTEDSLGFAKSTDGGVSWITATNHAIDLNGIRNRIFFNGIRVNGIPRIVVDKSGGLRNGWIYVTLAEKIITPARDSADITLCRSTDGGNTWTHTLVNQDNTGNYQWYPSVCCDPSGNIAIGYYDTRGLPFPAVQYYVSWSSNGGNTWVDILASDHTFIPYISELGQSFLGDYTGMTYSNSKFWPFWMDNSAPPYGEVYQVWTVGINPLGMNHNTNDVPKVYSLEQNYPNPFNPVTNIKYQIAKNSDVSLRVYDILGREVTVLVNEYKHAGYYEVEFDASKLSSGSYYYKLQSGEFSDTKKMMVIK